MARTFSRRGLLGRLLGFASVGIVAPAYAAPGAGAAHRYGLSLLDVDSSAGDGKDNTDAFEKAIGEVRKNNLGTLFVPGGVFPLRQLKLRDSVKIVGAGRGATILKTLASSADSLITLDDGPVRFSGLSNMTLRGGAPQHADNDGQWAMKLTARARPGRASQDGGVWWSEFRDLAVEFFDNGFFFEGGGKSYMLPHQFISVSNTLMYMLGQSAGKTLKMTGQNGQFLFQQVECDYFNSRSAGTSVQIGGDNADNINPAVVRFDVCTFQSAQQAVVLRGAQNIDFSSCWFENAGGGIAVSDNASGININGCRFANTGDAGAAVSFASQCTGTVNGSVFAGAKTKKSVAAPADAAVARTGNSFLGGAVE